MSNYLGDAIAQSLTAMFLGCIAVSAVLGWALIEGLIWLWHHVHIGIV